ncbi:MAG: PAS domain S-box protein [Spirochaetales bacterium]|nr:PAS domain S-box protein [Spirochaetales bacterium]
MKGNIPAKTLSVLLIMTVFTFSLAGEEQNRSVLFISSYHPSFSTFIHQVEGIRDTFKPQDIEFDVEFMDTKRFPGEENRQMFRQYLSFKLANSNTYDLVITGDDNALTFALQEQEGLFKGMPIIFFGVNDIETALSMNDLPGVTGVIEKVSMRDTIGLMINQNPELRNITAIVDGTPSGKGDLKTFWSEKEHFPGYNFLNLDLRKLSWDELADGLVQLNRRSAILLLSAYFDRESESKSFNQSLKLIYASSEVPIYHLWYHGLGDGILGGRLISHYDQAETAAGMALEIFRGGSIDSMKVIETSPNRYFFDYNELERFGISMDNLPEGSEVINSPGTFAKDHIVKIIIYSSVFILLLITLLVLLLNYIKRRKAEVFLRHLRQAAEQIIDTIELYDRKRRLIYANPAFLSMHGCTLTDILGRRPEEIFRSTTAENLRKTEELWKDVEKGTPWRGQFTNNKKDGAPLVQDISISPFYDEKNQISGFVSIKKDISEMVGLMEERRSILEHLLQAQKLESIGQLAGGIAHDFNNILSGIMSSSQLLLNPERSLDEKSRKYARMIYESCGDGAELVSRLINFSQSNRSSIRRVDMQTLVEEVVEILRITIKKNIDFHFENESAPCFINCESSSLQNALLNLGINAGQAVEPGGTVAFIMNERSLNRDYCYRSLYSVYPGRYCSIKVTDTGQGIPDDIREKIFDPFFTTKETGDAIGLGLTSVKRIVEEHRGCIELTSSPEGTTFELLIPLDLESLNI